MGGDEIGELVHAVAAGPDEPLGRAVVVVAPQPPQDALVGHVAQEGVLEDVFARALEGGLLARVDQLALPQRGEQRREDLRLGLAQVGHGRVPKETADDGSALQRLALGRWQAVEAGLQHARQRGWYVDGVQPFGVDGPALVLVQHRPLVARPGRCQVARAALDDALLDEHLDQFFDVEGVALGAGDD